MLQREQPPPRPLRLILKSTDKTLGTNSSAEFSIQWPLELNGKTTYAMHLETLYISEDGVNSAGLANTVFEVACGMPATNVYDSRRRGASDTLAFCQGYSHDESSGGRVGLHISTDTLRGATLTLSFKRVNGSPLSQLDTTVGLQWVATLLILPL